MEPRTPTFLNLTDGPLQLPGSGSSDPQVYADEVVQKGYSVIDGLYSPDEVEDIRAELAALYEQTQRPPLHSRYTQFLAPNIRIERTGANYYSVADQRPGLSRYRMKPFVFQVLRRLLGDDFILDMTLCQICDQSRPFLTWHHHLGGLDQDLYQDLYDRERLAAIDVPRRLNVFVYLDDISPAGGQLLLYPKVVSPLEPPFPETRPEWDGRVAANFSKGTVVLLDQATWHAATSRSLPGLRMIFGIYVSERHAPHRLWAEGRAVPEGLVIEPIPPTHPGMNPAVGTVPVALSDESTLSSRRILEIDFPDWKWVTTRANGRDVFFYLRTPSRNHIIVSAGPADDLGTKYAFTPGIAWNFLADNLPGADQQALLQVIPVLHDAAAPVVTGSASEFSSPSEVPIIRASDDSVDATVALAQMSGDFEKALQSLSLPGWSVGSSLRRADQILLQLERDSMEDVSSGSVPSRLPGTSGQEEGEKGLTIQIEKARPDLRAFQVIGGIAYSYRGNLEGDRLRELRRVLESIHAKMGASLSEALA